MSKGGSLARIAPGIKFLRNIYSRNNLPQSIILGRKIPQEFFSGIKIPDFFRNIIPGAQEYYSWSSGILFLDIFQLLGTFLPGFAQNSRYVLEISARFAQISRDLLDFSSWFAQNSRYVLKFLGTFVALNTNLSLRNFINDSGFYSHSTIHSTTKILKL